MMKNENALWQNIRKNCKRIKFFRVENGCDPGMPDLHFITPTGLAGWLELKYIPKITKKIELRSVQRAWITEYDAHWGGCALLLVQVSTESLYLISGKDLPKLECSGDLLPPPSPHFGKVIDYVKPIAVLNFDDRFSAVKNPMANKAWIWYNLEDWLITAAKRYY